MMAMELVTDRETKEPAKQATSQVVADSARNGLLTLKAGIHDNVVRILAPLVMEEHLLSEGLDILDQALAGASAWRRRTDLRAMWVAGAELAGPGRGGRQPGHRGAAGRGASARPTRSRAVEAARAALPGWRRTPAGEGELLHGVAAWLREHTDELGRLMTLEGGKPLVENTDEVGWTANAFSYYAELGRHERGRVIPSVEEGSCAGPQGAGRGGGRIVPWNYPLLLLAWKVAPPWRRNTVVVKPSPYTPLASLRLAEAFAGFPDGWSTWSPAGPRSARPWSHGTGLVAFTGSVATGQASGPLRRGVKDPPGAGRQGRLHRLDDVDLEVAAPARLGGLPQRRPGLTSASASSRSRCSTSSSTAWSR